MQMNQNGRINNEGDAFSILVVGDLILDTYVFGTSNRLSPEAPVPVMNPSNTKYAAGGAANVALNLQSLGAKVTLCGITGRDEFSSRLVECLGPVECHIQKENITIISQQFHNERAIAIANAKGMNAVGFNAKNVGGRSGFKIKVREVLARVAMCIDLVIGKQPKFLGKKITIK